MLRLAHDHHHVQDPAMPAKTILAVAVAVFMTGCVSQSTYDQQVAQNQQLQAQNQQLQAQNAAAQQQIVRLQGAIRYTVNSDLLFKSGSWDMSPDGQSIIARLAKKLAPTQQNHLVVAGYTDDAPIGPSLKRAGVTTNVELSQKRAEAVMQFIISQGVRPELISAKGFGESDPVAPNNTPAGRAQNRRVEISIATPGE
jgi:chemotaxis protein MotB